jgi:guanylate kinase
MTTRRGPLIILSGPSGSGKSTVLKRLLENSEVPLHLSVSATTRGKRAGEQEGIDYYFWSRPRFEAAVAAGEFLEWAEVHGNYYGTLKREVDAYRQKGVGVLLDIDVQGAEQVRQQVPDQVSVFLSAPSLAELERRLRARGTEDDATLQRRLARAHSEMARAGEYDDQIINDDLNQAVAKLREIVRRQFERGEHAG